MQKIRQHPVLAAIFIILAAFTLLNLLQIMQAAGTPADIGIIVLLPKATIAGLLALYVLNLILHQPGKPQSAPLKAGQTTMPRTTAIVAATLSGCVAAFFTYQLMSMATYSLGQGSNSAVPLTFYVLFAVPLAIAIFVFIKSLQSLRKK